jgi:hypothetical protein
MIFRDSGLSSRMSLSGYYIVSPAFHEAACDIRTDSVVVDGIFIFSFCLFSFSFLRVYWYWWNA